MGTMPPNELLKLWKLEEITVEMAIGHILQNIVNLQKTCDAQKIILHNIRSDIDSLAIHTGMKSKPIAKKSSKGN